MSLPVNGPQEDANTVTAGTHSPSLLPANPQARRRLQRIGIIVCILAALAHNVATTWQRWGDPIMDTGRELDTAKQLLAGKTLYADVRYWYGPLAPYANALLYGAFGVRVGVLTTAGVVSAAILTCLAYRLTRVFIGRLAAAAAAVAFLYVNAFPQYYEVNIFNFALPYAYPATYGMLLATASVYFLLRHVRRGRRGDFLLSCVFLSLTALCKIEVLFAATAAHIAFLVGWLAIGRWKRLEYPVGYLAACAVPACVYAGFYARAGEALWKDNLFLPGNLAANPYTLGAAGFLNLTESLRDLGLSAAGMATCILLMWVAVCIERRTFGNPSRNMPIRDQAAGALILALALACGGVCWLLGPALEFRALPVLLLAGVLVLAKRGSAKPADRAGQVAGIVLFAFGLGGAARMILRCGAEHYGFYLLVPGFLGFAAFWCRFVPGLLSTAHTIPTAAYLCGVLMLVGTAASHAVETRRTMIACRDDGPDPRIHTRVGTLGSLPADRGTVGEAVHFLQDKPPETKVVSLPDGSAITFMAGCTNPLGIHVFAPADLSGDYDEEAIVRRLAEADPDFILASPDEIEDGKHFGINYGLRIMNWVLANYEPVRQFRSPTNAIFVFARRSAAAPTSRPNR